MRHALRFGEYIAALMVSCSMAACSGDEGATTIFLRHRVAFIPGSACVVLDDGGVACWGAGQDGQLGLPTRADSATPVRVPGVVGIVTLAGGGGAFCAADAAGAVWCWGRRFGGRVWGDTAQRMAGLDASRALVVGEARVCGVSDAGLRCAFGDALDESLRSRTDLVDYDDRTECVLTVGAEVICLAGTARNPRTATIASGAAALDGRCWIDASGTRTCEDPAVPDDSLTNVARVGTGGGGEPCHLLRDGRVVCRAGDYWLPLPIEQRLAEVSGSRTQGCALADDGAALCWGDNIAGVLGPTAGPSSERPIRIPGVAVGGDPELVEVTPTGSVCFAPDADSDGLSDWNEGVDDIDVDGIPAWRDSDTDGDGIDDVAEAPSLPPCTIARFLPSSCDADEWPDYADLDQDDDGVRDRDEPVDARCSADSDDDGCADVATARFGACDAHHDALIVNRYPETALSRASFTLTVPATGTDPGEVWLQEAEPSTGTLFFSPISVASGVATLGVDRFVDTQAGARLVFEVQRHPYAYGYRGPNGSAGVEEHTLSLVDSTGTVLDTATLLVVIAAMPAPFGP